LLPQNRAGPSAEIHLGRLHYNSDNADGESAGLDAVNK
jgi:hypothetical protein